MKWGEVPVCMSDSQQTICISVFENILQPNPGFPWSQWKMTSKNHHSLHHLNFPHILIMTFLFPPFQLWFIELVVSEVKAHTTSKLQIPSHSSVSNQLEKKARLRSHSPRTQKVGLYFEQAHLAWPSTWTYISSVKSSQIKLEEKVCTYPPLKINSLSFICPNSEDYVQNHWGERDLAIHHEDFWITLCYLPIGHFTSLLFTLSLWKVRTKVSFHLTELLWGLPVEGASLCYYSQLSLRAALEKPIRGPQPWRSN